VEIARLDFEHDLDEFLHGDRHLAPYRTTGSAAGHASRQRIMNLILWIAAMRHKTVVRCNLPNLYFEQEGIQQLPSMAAETACMFGTACCPSTQAPLRRRPSAPQFASHICRTASLPISFQQSKGILNIKLSQVPRQLLASPLRVRITMSGDLELCAVFPVFTFIASQRLSCIKRIQRFTRGT
jgi:hypothetical protein